SNPFSLARRKSSKGVLLPSEQVEWTWRSYFFIRNVYHLRFEGFPKADEYFNLNILDQIEDILSARTPVINDKIGMHGGNGRPSYRKPFEAALVNHPASSAPFGIAENTPARFLRERLGLFPVFDDPTLFFFHSFIGGQRKTGSDNRPLHFLKG